MDLTVAYDNSNCNLVEFFWPVEGRTSVDVYDTLINAFGSMGAAAPYLNASAVFKSVDGSSIGCYEHWRKDTDLDGLFSTVLAPVMISLEAVATHDFCVTDLIAGGSKSGTPQVFRVGKVFYIAEFPLDRDYQDKFVSDIQAFLNKQLLGVAELISYTISKATDDSRIVIIEEWKSAAAAEKLAVALTKLPDSPLKDRNHSRSSNIFENIYVHSNAEAPAKTSGLQSSSEVIIKEWESPAVAEKLTTAPLTKLSDPSLGEYDPSKCSNIFENTYAHSNAEALAGIGDLQSSS